MNLSTYIYKIFCIILANYTKFIYFYILWLTVLKYGVIIYACSKNQFIVHKTKRIDSTHHSSSTLFRPNPIRKLLNLL